jgi:hypothetical protein
MGVARLELARPNGQQILSLSRLPFRHTPKCAFTLLKLDSVNLSRIANISQIISRCKPVEKLLKLSHRTARFMATMRCQKLN